MFLVGLTGGIASGKSTVSKEFKSLGCPCVDADLIARKVVEIGEPAYFKVKEVFGGEVFHEDGQLNREQLGTIIFNDSTKRMQLNSILHPAIKKRMLWEIFIYFLKGYQFILLDVPLLFETKQMLPFVSYTIVVYCNEATQLNRLMQRNGLTEEEADVRIKSQMPLSEKCRLGNYIIDNNEDLEQTKQQVASLCSKLKSSKKHYLLRFGLFSFSLCIIYGFIFAMQ